MKIIFCQHPQVSSLMLFSCILCSKPICISKILQMKPNFRCMVYVLCAVWYVCEKLEKKVSKHKSPLMQTMFRPKYRKEWKYLQCGPPSPAASIKRRMVVGFSFHCYVFWNLTIYGQWSLRSAISGWKYFPLFYSFFSPRKKTAEFSVRMC